MTFTFLMAEATVTDKDLYAAYRKSAPKLDIAFLVRLHPEVLTVSAEAAALAAKDKPTRADAARVACIWRSLTPYCRVNTEAEFWVQHKERCSDVSIL